MRLLVLMAAAAQAAVPQAVPQQRAGAGKGFLPLSPQQIGDAPWSSHASGSKETHGHHIQRRGTLHIADCRHAAASAAACMPLFLHPGKRCSSPCTTSVQFPSLIFLFSVFFFFFFFFLFPSSSSALGVPWVAPCFFEKKEGFERAHSEKVTALCSLRLAPRAF